MGITRSPHNRVNPYVCILKNSLWDPNLSCEEAGFLCRLISRPDDWYFNVAELAKTFNFSHDKVNRLLNRLIEEGYAYRIQRRKANSEGKYKNRFSKYDIEILEEKLSKEEISNILSEPVLSGPITDGSDKLRHLLSNDLEDQVKKEENKECPASVPSASPVGETTPINVSNPPFKEGRIAAEYFDNKLSELYPDRKRANLNEWAKEFDKIHRIDKKSWKEIRDVIDWALDDSFWVKNVLSPSKLRKQWDKLNAARKPPLNKGNRIKANFMTAQDLNEFLKSKRYDRVKNFSLKHDRVDNLDTGETFSFDMEINEFNMKICKAFGVTGLP